MVSSIRAPMSDEELPLVVPWSDLRNKVVLVTGASSGIGRELCLDLARSGCNVIAAARRVDLLNDLCREINSSFSSSVSLLPALSPPAIAVEMDVSAAGEAIDRAVQVAWDLFGRIDAVVNNAGFRGALSFRGTVKSPLDLSEEEWNNAIKTNLTGSWLVSKSVCKRMRDAKGGGVVINISSISSLNRGQFHGGLAYDSSKSGVNTMTRVMALELGMYKIRVNSICPGLFNSEVTKDLIKKDWLPKVAQKMLPLRAFGPVDPAITSLVRYLIHDSSGYVTGNTFIVDAGMTLPTVPIYSSL